jgi:hypothetical protein
MAIGKAIENIGDLLSNTVRRVTDGDFAKNATSAFYDKVVRKVGKAAGNATLKAGAGTTKAAAETVDHFRRNKENYKNVGKAFAKFGGDTVKEANTVFQAGVGAMEMLKKVGILETTDNLGQSLIGIKFTKGAKLGMLPLAAAVGTMQGTRDHLTNRQGRNDGQTYSVTPSTSNPYELSQQLAYSQAGRSFSHNAGADGDLIRAISGMR